MGGKGGKKGGEFGKKGGKEGGKAAAAVVQLPQASDDDELIWTAVTDCVAPILHLETELDQNKLEKRIRDNFRKGAKGLPFHSKPWYELIEEYADASFGGLFNSLGDKEWLPQCDFLLCLDAGIKDNFPKQCLARVPQLEFERVVLAAHDRAHEEQRTMPIMWEVVQGSIEGPKGKKKVYNALEEAWKEAQQAAGGEDVQSFVGTWLDRTIAHLAEVSQGEPQWVLEPPIAMQVFDALLQSGALPFALVEAHGPPPPGWQFIEYCVHQSYAAHVVTEDGTVFGEKGPRKGGKGKGKKGEKERKPRKENPLFADIAPGVCRDYLLDRCQRGEECRFTHDDIAKQEVELKQALQEAGAEEADEGEAKRARLV